MTARKKTILFVTGTRAEWGLMQSTILRLRKSPTVRVKVLVTGMHTQRRFGYTLDAVRKAVPVEHVVPVGECDDQLTALSKEIAGIRRYLLRHPVDALLVVGDRDEPFAAAIVGVHLNIPVLHIAGGDVTGPTVDQYLRSAITLFSRLHLVQTARSRQNVRALGADPRRIKVVGAPGLDQLKPGSLIRRKELAKRLRLDPRQRWFLVSLHPTILDAAPVSQQIRSLLDALKHLSPQDEKVILYPNADDGNEEFIRALEALRGQPGVHLERHLDRREYLSLMRASAALIGNSSSGLIEAGFLRTPFVHVGNRQQHREFGSNVLFADYDARSITRGIRKALTLQFRRNLRKPSPYKGGAVAERIVRAIEDFLSAP